MLVDTHAHLFWDSYKDDLDQVIQNCLKNNVTTVINIGIDITLSEKAAKLESDKIKFYSSIGIHPEEATKYDTSSPEDSIQTDMDILEKIYQENKGKVIGVGECGLDYLFAQDKKWPSPEQIKEFQRLLFKSQINLAKKLNLPLLIHVRDDRSENPELIEAWDEAVEMVGNHPTVLHCYSGLMPTTKKSLVKGNILISFAGNLTYKKNEYLREAVKVIPLEKILLETDSPFLPPQSIRGKRNEPSYVLEVAKNIAEIKRISLDEVADKSTENFKRFFNL